MKSSRGQSPSRKLRRFVSDVPLLQEGQLIDLSPAESRHLAGTLRLKEGDNCLLTDGQGRQAQALVLGISKDGRVRVEVSFLEKPGAASRGLHITVYAALLQRGKFDYMVEKGQELGLDAMIPLETERTVARMDKAAGRKVVERWGKIARESAKQSGSLELVKLSEPIAYGKALGSLASGEENVLFHPGPESVSFSDWAKGLSQGRRLNLFIGPEGGFSAQEVRAARAAGLKQVALTHSLLKADTAFLGILSALRFLYL